MSAAYEALDPLARDALAALSLGVTARWARWVHELLAEPALRSEKGPVPTREQVVQALARARSAGLVEDDPRRPGCQAVALHACAHIYARLLDRVPRETLRGALARVDQYPPIALSQQAYWRFPSAEAALARLRLELFCGASSAEVAPLVRRLPYGLADEEQLFDAAITQVLDAHLLARLHPSFQRDELFKTLFRAVQALTPGADLDLAQVVAHSTALLAQDHSLATGPLRAALADYRLAATPAEGRDEAWSAGLQALMAPALDAPVLAAGLDVEDRMAAQMLAAAAQGVHGATLALRGQWAAAEAEFDRVLAATKKASGKRRGLLPLPQLMPYVLALLAQRTPAHLEKALKFCLAEGGKKQPVPDHPMGLVALAVQMRLGEAPRDPAPFRPFAAPWRGSGATVSTAANTLDFWRWMMRAWLKEGAQADTLTPTEADAAQRLSAGYARVGLAGQAEQLAAALAVLAGERAPEWFFVPAGQERWQATLAALQAAAAPAVLPGAASGDAAAETRIVWLVELGDAGAIEAIVPHEQKRGVRGWGTLKEAPLSRLQRTADALPAHDAAVARTIRLPSFGRTPHVDLAAAIGALIGHPAVAFAEAPNQLIDLREGSPELEVIDEGERLRVRMQPALRVARDEAVARWGGPEADEKERAALRLVTVWRDGAQGGRVIRLTPAQKRVAQLLGEGGLEIPRKGAAQLQEVLANLGSHFRIQADEAGAATPARELPAESRLRAELQPLGAGLQVRLQVAPFGQDHAKDGPRLIPGRGRGHLVASLGGETLGVQRDLKAERAHLDSVIDTCPMLVELAPDAPCEWLLESPDDALALIERLHAHTAVMALDWPQGRPVRVDTAALGAMTVRIKSNQEWLAVNGEIKIDEELVVSLQQLIAFSASSRSRFMPLGEGRYLALTQELRERVDDLAAVAEARAAKGTSLADVRIPSVAAPWLEAAVQGATVEHDAAFARRLEALDAARRVVPALPHTLQATLRPYQEEGFEWAMRLASAGLGACLADDMGLGKTLQALAVLLARAAQGPALVVAPTSLIGNWRAEARRFAPTLRMHVYAEGGAIGERERRVAEMGKHDVLLVSYPMLLNDSDAFAARTWTTLILDEAQAIKNAAAKRSQAVFDLQAGFRLALSGTPIENRLAELWSIMRACNPGLLGTQARFNERFANLIEKQRDRHAQRLLRRLIAPFILRRTKAQVLDDLPPRTELVLNVTPADAERAHYEALRRDVLAAAERSLNGDAPGQAQLNILAGLTRLRRAACDPRLVSPELKLPGAKVQAFAELAAELVANGHKALVFSQFVDFLALLREPLDAAGIAYQYLDGSTPMAERTRRVDAFQAGEGELFLISLKAGGFGLNLTLADYVVIADPWWNPAAEDQASGRAHRIGQLRPVTVYRIVNQGTLEDRIIGLHQTKRELADSVLESDGASTAPPSAVELLSLMRDGPSDPGRDAPSAE